MTLPAGAAWFDALLRRCADLGGSDLTLEPQDDHSLRAILRRDGLRSELDHCSAADSGAAIGRAKALAQIPSYIVDEIQDGRIDGRPMGFGGELRLAVLPTVRGQRLAVRLPAVGPLPKPDDLGLPGESLALLRQNLAQPDGLLIVSGPTGSGKTTTIHSLLREQADSRNDRVLLSIEDPVERLLGGVVQVEADGRLRFSDALRAALRQDADVIVVGECRDRETTTTAIRAALAGHLVVTTVHAPRAREVVPRLLEMGVDADLLLSALRLICTQRLLRRQRGGRQVIVDTLPVDEAARQAWRHSQGETVSLHTDMDRQAAALMEAQAVEPGEVARVLGNAISTP